MKRGLAMLVCLMLAAACRFSSATATQTSARATATAALGIGPSAPPSDRSAMSTPSRRSLPTSAAIGSVNIQNASVVYYDISGSSESELRAELDAKSPVGYDGYKGDATTNWFIRWNWPGYGSRSCDLSQATVTYEIEVIFPRWTSTDDAPPELVAKWADFSRALAGHEENHADFVAANYQSVLDAIRSATCETADAAATSALEPLRQHDRDYDAATNHGETEGARFP